MIRAEPPANRGSLWRALFAEQHATLTTVARILSNCPVSPEHILEKALAALDGSPARECFESAYAIRAVVKAALAHSGAVADSLTEEAVQDPSQQALPKPTGDKAWLERVVYFMRCVLRYSRRDTALLIGITDANTDQIYTSATMRIRCFSNRPFCSLPDASGIHGANPSNHKLIASLKEESIMNFNRLFNALEENPERARTDRANEARFSQGALMISKCLLCLLLIATPIFGQVSALPRADDHCSDISSGNNVNVPHGVEAFAASSSCNVAVAPGSANVGADPSNSALARAHDGQQTKRILYVMPTFHAVSTGTHLPAQTPRQKVMNATQDSFDYSSFMFVGVLAGLGQAKNATSEFGEGAVGYGRYYWHALVDQTDENYLVEGLMPILLRQDTRYYTLGRGGFVAAKPVRG